MTKGLLGWRFQGSLLDACQCTSPGDRGDRTLLIFLCRFVDDSAMLQAAEIKHSDTAVSATADEDIHAVRAKSNVVNLLVVCD